MLRRISVVMINIGASLFTAASPVTSPTFSSPNSSLHVIQSGTYSIDFSHTYNISCKRRVVKIKQCMRTVQLSTRKSGAEDKGCEAEAENEDAPEITKFLIRKCLERRSVEQTFSSCDCGSSSGLSYESLTTTCWCTYN